MFLRSPSLKCILATVALHNWLKSMKIARNAMAVCTVHWVTLTMRILMDFFIKEFGDPKFVTQDFCKKSAKWGQIITQNQLNTIDWYLLPTLCPNRVNYHGSKIMFTEHPTSLFPKQTSDCLLPYFTT